MSNECDDDSYLLRLSPEEITSYVRTNGMLVFMNTLTELQNAQIAAKAIEYLDKKNLELTFFLDSFMHEDTSRKIEYGIIDHNSTLAVVHLKKTIYHLYTDMSSVIVGPIVRRENAQPLVDILNSILGR